MDLKNQKLSFKSKVSDLMQEYERQKSEEQYQKQQMKKQIMLDIMNKRQKAQIDPQREKSNNQSIENIEKVTQNVIPQQEKQPIQQQLYLKESAYMKNEAKTTFGKEGKPNLQSRALQYQEEDHQFDKIEELTFNMKRRNKSLEEQINIKALLKDDEDLWKAKQEKPSVEENKSSSSYSKIHAWQKSELKPVEKEDSQEDTDEKEEEQPILPSGKYSKYFKGSEMAVESRSYYGNKTDYLQREQDRQDDHDEEAEPNEVQEEVEPEDNRGVFLTMEESQSMTASEMPKNYAFEIKNDKSIDPESMEEMKKQKIKELEKKRQVRIEQFRRNQSQKKVEMPKGRNSYSKKHDKVQKDDYNEPDLPPRSGTIEKKNPSQRSSKVQKQLPMSKNQPFNRNQPAIRNQLVGRNSQAIIETHDSQYNIKPTPKQYTNFSQNYQQAKIPISKQLNNYPSSNEDREVKPISPFRTPKSMLTDNRGKSQNKNTNIFSIENQNPREKSGTKIITEPKIQPKDRKNSFTKQSNKKLMINAITYVCFPGQLNRRQRERLIDVLETSEYEFFIFLFKQYSRKIIKGIYILDNTQTKLQKIYGQKAPAEITVDRVQQFYRFDSGSRQFKKVDGCRSFSLSIHAIDQR